VLLNVGLCIALWVHICVHHFFFTRFCVLFTLTLQDITKRGESFIMPGRSGHHTKVEFRFVVFRPFMEEILVGKVKSCNKEHVQGIYSYFK